MNVINALGNATVLAIGIGFAAIVWHYVLSLWGVL